MSQSNHLRPRPLLNFGPRDDYVHCSSRGSSRNSEGNPITILSHLNSKLSKMYYPNTSNRLLFDITTGSKINRIVNSIISEHHRRGSPNNSHAYVIGGYCDVTDREKILNYRTKNYATGAVQYARYEEVTFQSTVNEAYIEAIHRYTRAANNLVSEGIRPCFATIPPSCLDKWNDYRLYHGNTAFLLHTSQYNDMQEGLNAALTKINGFICKLNALYHMETPYLAGTVVKTWSARNRGITLQRHKLYDGVHADDELIEVWADKIKSAIDKNRAKPDSIMPELRMHTARQLAMILEGIRI